MSFGDLRATVIAPGLCVRCGACMGACPTRAIVPGPGRFPVLCGKCTDCGLCTRVCPGAEVDLPRLCGEASGCAYDPGDLFGPHRALHVAWAASNDVRQAGASGGVLTALLGHLMESGQVDGALVCGPSNDPPWQSEGHLARRPAELLSLAQSRYTFTPHLALLADLPPGGPWAVTALPCQAQAIRKIREAAPELGRRIGPVLGLYCHFNLEIESVEDLLAANGIDAGTVARVEYRGGEWPGTIRAHLRDGSVRGLHRVGYGEMITLLLRLYGGKRCLLCVDPSNELADVAVGDVWAGDYRPGLAEPKSSLLTVRTDRGAALVAAAIREGRLGSRELAPEDYPPRHLSFFREKKENAWTRIARLRQGGLPVPDYGIPPPAPSLGRRVRERVLALTLLPRRHPRLRRMLLGWGISLPGRMVAALNSRRKKLFIGRGRV